MPSRGVFNKRRRRTIPTTMSTIRRDRIIVRTDESPVERVLTVLPPSGAYFSHDSLLRCEPTGELVRVVGQRPWLATRKRRRRGR